MRMNNKNSVVFYLNKISISILIISLLFFHLRIKVVPSRHHERKDKSTQAAKAKDTT